MNGVTKDDQTKASAAEVAAATTAENEAGTHNVTSDEQVAVKAAFARLGIDIDDDGNSAGEVFIAALNGVADQLEAKDARIKELENQRDNATRQARAAKSAAGGSKPRKIGRMDFPDGAPTPADLRELLEGAGEVEVVPSDGSQEVLGASVTIEGDNPWQDTAAGLKLNVADFTIHGPGAGSKQAAIAIQGYALLVDGKQVAWSQRPEQLTIGTGQTMQLKDDVIF